MRVSWHVVAKLLIISPKIYKNALVPAVRLTDNILLNSITLEGRKMGSLLLRVKLNEQIFFQVNLFISFIE